ncbi:MAG: adenylate kinase [Candidatus Eremiobacteraeota bacterium]|nr:adenylate kinase [Candidatus Eremiobacteraeota bacterium]
MNLILLGMPGAGKGTQGHLIKEAFGIAHISTGDMFREAIKNSTPVGMRAKRFMDRGELVPDEVVLDMVKERLEKDDCRKGFILDGFPRTVKQAEALDGMLSLKGVKIEAVIDFSIPKEEAVRRLSSRRSCRSCQEIYNLLGRPPIKQDICDECGGELYQRDDDKEEVILNRLDVYEQQTAPLLKYYDAKGNLHALNAGAPVEVIMEQVRELLKEHAVS